jgi:hypothetical protein
MPNLLVESNFCSAPPIINVKLTNAVTHTVETGDDITVTTILRASPEQTSQTRKRSANLLPTGARKINLEAVSVLVNTAKKRKCIEKCTPIDMKLFHTIQTEPMGVFRFLVHSVCPAINGHEMVKAGFLMALFLHQFLACEQTYMCSLSAIPGREKVLCYRCVSVRRLVMSAFWLSYTKIVVSSGLSMFVCFCVFHFTATITQRAEISKKKSANYLNAQ